MAEQDRVLLEQAARAAGMAGWKFSGSGMSKMIDPSRPTETGSIGPDWNPLESDADVFRLAVKLGIYIGQTAVRGYRFTQHQSLEDTFYEDDSGDPYAATRRAIVRAAAALGNQGGAAMEGMTP